MKGTILKLSDDLYINTDEIVAVYWSTSVELVGVACTQVSLIISMTGDTLYICDTKLAGKLLDHLSNNCNFC